MSFANQERTRGPTYLNSVCGIFAYGTLRADFCPGGDKWGVIDNHPGARIYRGFVRGFDLYQEHNLTYPYVVRTPEISSLVKGTVMLWDDKSLLEDALVECNHIEG